MNAAGEPVAPLVRIAGPIDAGAAGRIRAMIEAALGSRTRLVVLDLSEVGFVDSSGLGMLIDARVAAASAGVRLVLRRPPSQLQRLMVMTQTYADFDWA